MCISCLRAPWAGLLADHKNQLLDHTCKYVNLFCPSLSSLYFCGSPHHVFANLDYFFSKFAPRPRRKHDFEGCIVANSRRKSSLALQLEPKNPVLSIHVAIPNLQNPLQKCIFPAYGLSQVCISCIIVCSICVRHVQDTFSHRNLLTF